MALPNAVRKQVKDAEKAMEKMAQPAEEVQEETPAPEQPVEEAAHEEKVQEEAGQEDAHAEEEVEEPIHNKEADLEYWKQKYSSLEGKYRNEVPELHDQLRNMEQILANLSAQDEPVKPGPAQNLITADEIEDYGSDMISVMRKAAKEALGGDIEALRKENERLRNSLKNVSVATQETAREGMIRVMDKEVPGWKEQNEDQGFVAWLQNRDVYSGISRQELLVDAWNRNDTARVVALFRGYIDQNALERGAQTEPAPVEEKPQQPQVNMDTLVAPGGSKASPAASAASGKRSFTQAEIAAFYADVRTGKYRKRPEEQQKLEAEIFSAVNEGRIRY
jgi:hypothetical protein